MHDRRHALKTATALAALLASAGYPQWAAAYSKQAFDAKTVPEVTKALGLPALTESREVSLTAPDVAENGAAVSVSLGTSSFSR